MNIRNFIAGFAGMLIALSAIAQSPSQQIIAYQYYFDTDPGVGVAGNGAIVPITPNATFNQTVVINTPGSLNSGVHYLYVRTMDQANSWSIAERAMFYILPSSVTTQTITAYQYFFDTDPGVDVAGNGAVVSVSPTATYNNTISIITPGSLSNGVHYLYVRTKDNFNRWSIAERNMFYIQPINISTQTVTAYQYYFDNDPGAGVAGNGAVVAVSPTATFNQTVSIVTPGSLNSGVHYLYVRTKDEFDRWGIAERSMFYIQPSNVNTQTVTALEYYFDNDPGAGNGIAIPVTTAAIINTTFQLGVSCLTTGTHYMYVRAKDEFGKWGIIERDTLNISPGVTASAIVPAGPVILCTGNTVTLSQTTPSSGFTYQWLESGNNISGATNATYTAGTTGNYSLKVSCGANFAVSNVVAVTVNPPATYYADADGDGFGNAAVSQNACAQPANYVSNDDDCNDANASIHPSVYPAAGTTLNPFFNFSMDFDNAFSISSPVTQTGIQYAIKVTGTFSMYCSPNIMDGAYEIMNLSCASITPSPFSYWAFNGTNNSIRPAPDVYNPAHEYWFYFNGNGAAQLFQFGDSFYGDNSGSLSFTMYSVSNNEICNNLDDDCDGIVDEGVAPSAPTVSSPVSYCQNAAASPLTATGSNLLWYTTPSGGTGSSTAPTPSTVSIGTTSYYVSQTITCESPRKQIDVIVTGLTALTGKSISSVTLFNGGALPDAACNGDIIHIRANGITNFAGLQYSWNKTSSSGNLMYSMDGSTNWMSTLVTFTNDVYVQLLNLGVGYSAYKPCVKAITSCQATASNCQWIRGTVSGPSTLAGYTIVCPSTTQSYTCATSTGATQYIWTLAGNPITPSGQTSTNVTVNIPPTFVNGQQLCVTAQLACGATSASAPKCVTLTSSVASLGNIVGAGSVCPGENQQYSVPVLNGSSVTYSWTAPAGSTPLTQPGNPVSVTYPNPYSGNPTVCVTASNSCAPPSTAVKCINVSTKTPAMPGNITGPTAGLCAPVDVTYSVPSQGSASFNWTYPTGQGTTATATGQGQSYHYNAPAPPFTSGTLSVAAVNTTCSPVAMSPPRSVTIKGVPANPASITSTPNPPCIGGNQFTSSSIGATSYVWGTSLGTGAFDPPNPAGTTAVINWPAGTAAYTVNVTGKNDCGPSGTKVVSFTGTNVPCPARFAGAEESTNVSAYPNPAHDKLTVEFSFATAESAQLNLFDIAGRKILSQSFTSAEGNNMKEIDLNSVAKGIYILELKSAAVNQKMNIVVE